MRRDTTKMILMARCGRVCEMCRTHPATDAHEIARRGTGNDDLVFMPGNMLMLCRVCHERAHGMKSEDLLRVIAKVRTKEELGDFLRAWQENRKQQHPYIEAVKSYIDAR